MSFLQTNKQTNKQIRIDKPPPVCVCPSLVYSVHGGWGWGDMAHLLYELVALLQLEGSVLQGGGGPVVHLHPLLVGRLADLRHRKAQSAQP